MFQNYTEEKLNNLKTFLELEGYTIEKEYKRTSLYKKECANGIMVPNTVNLSDIEKSLGMVYETIVNNFLLEHSDFIKKEDFLFKLLDTVINNANKIENRYSLNNWDLIDLAYTLYDGNYIVININDINVNDNLLKSLTNADNIIKRNEKLKSIILKEYKDDIKSAINNKIKSISNDDIELILSDFILSNKLFVLYFEEI